MPARRLGGSRRRSAFVPLSRGIGAGNGDRGERAYAASLWKKRDRKGNVYFTGPMGGVQVFVFASAEKKGEKSPDARLMFAQREFQREGAPAGEGFGGADEGESYEASAEG